MAVAPSWWWRPASRRSKRLRRCSRWAWRRASWPPWARSTPSWPIADAARPSIRLAGPLLGVRFGRSRARGGLMSEPVYFEEPPVARRLFGSTTFAWLWLILRLYLGWEWLVSGWA